MLKASASAVDLVLGLNIVILFVLLTRSIEPKVSVEDLEADLG
jgi:hypothetical protein